MVRPIRITRHARNRMRWHRISEELVQVTSRAPEWEEPSVAGRVNRWKRVENRFLRVTCRDELERIVVISAVFKSRGPRRKENREDRV
jgi:hypothetical protein